MADNDVEGHFAILRSLMQARSWSGILGDLEFVVTTFERLGLARTAPDALVWQTCQENRIVLIAGNRNQEGPDSLEAAIRRGNQVDSMPVITISDTKRFMKERTYAEQVAAKVLDYLLYLERYLGAGRVYAP